MNPGSSVIDPRSYVTAPAAGATSSIFDPRTVTTTFRCTARPSKTCAARIVTGAPACCAGRLVGPATKISNQVRRRLVIGFTWLRMIPEIVRHFAWHGRKDEINVWKLCPTNAGTNHKRHSAATPQPNADAVAFWTELECVIFPSSQRRARSASPIGRSLKSGCAIKKMPRSHKSGGQFGWPSKACRTDHPVRDKSERILWFFMSRTPLLCEEGHVLCRKLCPKN